MGLWILIMIIWEIVIDIDRKYLYLWIGNKYYTYGYSWIIVIIIWEKNAREIDFFRFCWGYQLWAMAGHGIFSPPQNPKGGEPETHYELLEKKKAYFKF